MLDANAICRYLLRDIEDQYQTVLEEVQHSICVAEIEVIAEVVYVLEGVYEAKREDIVKSLRELCQDIRIEDSDVLLYALTIFDKTPKLDFIDCILYGYHVSRGYEILTFDKKLRSRLNSFDTGSV